MASWKNAFSSRVRSKAALLLGGDDAVLFWLTGFICLLMLQRCLIGENHQR